MIIRLFISQTIRFDTVADPKEGVTTKIHDKDNNFSIILQLAPKILTHKI